MTVEDSYLCGYLKIKGLTEVRFETRSDIVRLTFYSVKGWVQIGLHWLDTGETVTEIRGSKMWRWSVCSKCVKCLTMTLCKIGKGKGQRGPQLNFDCGKVEWKKCSDRLCLCLYRHDSCLNWQVLYEKVRPGWQMDICSHFRVVRQNSKRWLYHAHCNIFCWHIVHHRLLHNIKATWNFAPLNHPM